MTEALTFCHNVQVKCTCRLKSPKSDRGRENGDATSPGVRRNTPRAARKRRSFADIFDSDYDGSDPEYDPRESDPKTGKIKKVKKEHVVNGDASPSKPRRSSKSRISYTEEPDEGKRKSKRERKPSTKGKAGNNLSYEG